MKSGAGRAGWRRPCTIGERGLRNRVCACDGGGAWGTLGARRGRAACLHGREVRLRLGARELELLDDVGDLLEAVDVGVVLAHRVRDDQAATRRTGCGVLRGGRPHGRVRCAAADLACGCVWSMAMGGIHGGWGRTRSVASRRRRRLQGVHAGAAANTRGAHKVARSKSTTSSAWQTWHSLSSCARPRAQAATGARHVCEARAGGSHTDVWRRARRRTEGRARGGRGMPPRRVATQSHRSLSSETRAHHERQWHAAGRWPSVPAAAGDHG